MPERPASYRPTLSTTAALEARLPEVLIEWQALMSTEPWMMLPEEHRVDNLLGVLQKLLQLTERHDEPRVEALIGEACTHGLHRREMEWPDRLLFVEYQLLRDALWNVMKRVTLSADERLHLIQRIDLGITFAVRASLAAYHRPELEKSGRWPAAVQAMVADLYALIPSARVEPAE